MLSALLLSGCASSGKRDSGHDSAKAKAPNGAPAAPASSGPPPAVKWRGVPLLSAAPRPPEADFVRRWKLTLPVNQVGAPSGTAVELPVAAPTAPWLSRAADGSLTFWAPVAGARTANSEHARTELVSTRDFSFGSAVHMLSALLSVAQAPSETNDVCVGQVHGGGPIRSVAFVMLHWRDGNIVAVVKQALQGSDSRTVTVFAGVPLGARFGYTITDQGNGSVAITVTYNGETRQVTRHAKAVFLGTDERFQAGDYQQAVTSGSPADGGRVTFYGLTAS
ncbi:polysaccharide lyase family 7 protein [Kitasatospora sp. NPDC048296]|uniref:polysaccharide lyase family 7 protein n=1 Tax=Kitasatospora sp. NPDC048296 TaxID=3364048 RepID=UPI00371B2206